MPELEKDENPRRPNDSLTEVEILKKACEEYKVREDSLHEKREIAECFPKIIDATLIEEYRNKPPGLDSRRAPSSSVDEVTDALIAQTVLTINDSYHALTKSMQQHEKYMSHLKVRLADLTSEEVCADVNTNLSLVTTFGIEDAQTKVDDWKNSLGEVLFEIQTYQQELDSFYKSTVVEKIAGGDNDKLSNPCDKYYAAVGGFETLRATVDGNTCPDPSKNWYGYLRCIFGLDD